MARLTTALRLIQQLSEEPTHNAFALRRLKQEIICHVIVSRLLYYDEAFREIKEGVRGYFHWWVSFVVSCMECYERTRSDHTHTESLAQTAGSLDKLTLHHVLLEMLSFRIVCILSADWT